MNWHEIYVVVNDISGNFCFSYVFGYGKIMYANEVETKEKQITCGAVNFFPSSGAVMYANEFETKKTTNIEIKWNKK